MSSLTTTNKDNPEAVQDYYIATTQLGSSKISAYKELINPDISDVYAAIARLEKGELYISIHQTSLQAIDNVTVSKSKKMKQEAVDLYRKGMGAVSKMIDESENRKETKEALSEMEKVLAIPGAITGESGNAPPHQNYDLTGIVQ